MVRVYVQTRGKSYSEQTLLHAIKDVQQGMSQSKAADKHGIPQRTLSDKLRKAHPANVGRPTVLSDETEKQIANALDCLTDWGFPFQTIDLRIMVKNYLDNLNISQPQFRDNMPGADFVYGFLKRHKLVLRKATSLDKSRAAVSPTIVQEFFDRIKDVIDKTPPNRIYNYDETGFVPTTTSTGAEELQEINEDNDDERCTLCRKIFDDFNEDWTSCLVCEQWFCEICTGNSHILFVCSECSNCEE